MLRSGSFITADRDFADAGITAESTTLELTNPAAFQSLLMELGLLALIVIAIAVLVFILRRSGGDTTVTAE